MELQEAKKIVIDLLAKGHTAQLEEVYDQHHVLLSVNIHHYPMCKQCVKEREESSGKERKI